MNERIPACDVLIKICDSVVFLTFQILSCCNHLVENIPDRVSDGQWCAK